MREAAGPQTVEIRSARYEGCIPIDSLISFRLSPRHQRAYSSPQCIEDQKFDIGCSGKVVRDRRRNRERVRIVLAEMKFTWYRAFIFGRNTNRTDKFESVSIGDRLSGDYFKYIPSFGGTCPGSKIQEPRRRENPGVVLLQDKEAVERTWNAIASIRVQGISSRARP